jgi:osmotically-inducible protein OsmY
MLSSNLENPAGRATSEATLRDHIHEQLKRHGRVDASKVGVVVRGGQVLLWGSVSSELERVTAAEVARTVAGPLRVTNHIHVFQI